MMFQGTSIAAFKTAADPLNPVQLVDNYSVSILGTSNERLASDLQPVLTFFGNFLLAAALAAVVTVVLVQILKLPLRAAYHLLATHLWLQSRAANVHGLIDPKVPSWLVDAAGDSFKPIQPYEDPTFGQKLLFLAGLLPFVPTDLYTKKLQNVAQQLLEHPSLKPRLFSLFAADAAAEDRAVTMYVDHVVINDPRFLDRLAESRKEEKGGWPTGLRPIEPDHALAAAVASAQENVAAATERGLDDLQIRLLFWWPICVRAVAILVAIWLIRASSAGGLGLSMSIALGIGAGYLSSFAFDTLSVLGSLRPKP